MFRVFLNILSAVIKSIVLCLHEITTTSERLKIPRETSPAAYLIDGNRLADIVYVEQVKSVV